MKYVVWILFLILFVIGCNQQPGKVNAKLKISTANLIAGQNGGTMLYITHKGRNAQRSIPLQSNELTIILEDGLWDFAVLSWAGGNGPLSGALKCAKSTMDLKSTDTTINLNLSEAACDDNFFAPAAYRTAAAPQKINQVRIIDCHNIIGASSNGNCDGSAKGTSGSYKVKLLAYPEIPVNSLQGMNYNQQPNISTGCLSAASSPNSKTTPLFNFRIPTGGTGVKSSTLIETFSDTGCSNAGRKFFYPNGISGQETTLSNSSTFDSTGGFGDVFIETGILTISGNLNFQTTFLGNSSGIETLILSNDSNTTLTNLTASFTGGSFNFDGAYPGTGGTCGVSLSPGSTCSLKLKFTPTSAGNLTSTFNLTFMNPSSQTVTRTLSGTGVSPASLSFSPASYSYPSTVISTSSAIQTFNISNSGGVAATTGNNFFSISGANPGAYSFTHNCGNSILPSTGCSLNVQFNPSIPSTTSASIGISYYNGFINTSPGSDISLSGTGVEILTGTFSFPTTVIGGSSATQTYSITNNTANSLSNISANVSGGAYSIVTAPNCGASLAAGNSCTFTVAFAPSSSGTSNGTITLNFNDGTNKTITKNISGTGVTPANISLSTNSLNFGNVLFNSYNLMSVNFNNSGGTPATVSTINLTGTAFTIFNPGSTCSSILNAYSNCTVYFKYSPTSTNAESGSLSWTYSNGTGTSANTPTINFSGTGKELHVVNGEVKAIIKNGANKLIIGGTFERIGPRSGGGVLLNKSSSCTGTSCILSTISGGLSSLPKVEGIVNIVIPDGSTGYYIGGKFSKIGTTTVSNIAHINSSGAVDTNFTPSINNEVEALYFDGAYLFVGGKFTDIGGLTRTAFAVLSTTGAVQTSSLTIAAPSGQMASVKIIEPASSGGFYIGGLFNSVNSNTSVNNLVKINSSFQVDTSFILKIGSASDDYVKTIVSDGSKLYVGGRFSQSTTHNSSTFLSRNGIASYTITGTNPSLDADFFAYNSNAIINKIIHSGSSLYVGGIFTSNWSRTNFAQYSTALGISLATFTVTPNGAIYDMALDANDLYLAGSFNAIGTNQALGLAVINNGSLSSSYLPQLNKTVKSIAFNSGSIYAGGDFSSLGGVERKNLAEINLETGEATSFNIATNGSVNALVSNGSNIFMGGDFTSAGPSGNLQTRNRYAVFTPTGTFQNANPSFNNTINSLIIDGSYLYIGGAFSNINNGTTLNGLARINHSTWSLDTSFNASLNAGAVVKTMTVQGSVLYVGGSISSIASSSRNNLVGVNLSNATKTSFSPTISAGNNINKITSKAGTTHIYVAGAFSSIGGLARTNLALVDTNTTLGDTVTGFAPTFNGPVTGIAHTTSSLYTVGSFTSVNSDTTKIGYAKIDGTNGTLFSSTTGSSNLTTIFEDTNQMFIGGGFSTINGEYRSGLSVVGK